MSSVIRPEIYEGLKQAWLAAEEQLRSINAGVPVEVQFKLNNKPTALQWSKAHGSTWRIGVNDIDGNTYCPITDAPVIYRTACVTYFGELREKVRLASVKIEQEIIDATKALESMVKYGPSTKGE